MCNNLLVTKGELLIRSKSKADAASAIRKHARKLYFYVNSRKECKLCAYDKHVEVAHIKAVSSFPPTATLAEINSIDNLIGLCPNCHWEYDHGYFSLSDWLYKILYGITMKMSA